MGAYQRLKDEALTLPSKSPMDSSKTIVTILRIEK